MANYMAEVAKMLGVEMDQDFECNEIGYKYRITDRGLVGCGCWRADSLMMMLTGELTIKREPWKPQHGDSYYCVSRNGYVLNEIWYDDIMDNLCYKLGNCYKSKEQAKANLAKWIAFYSSDDVLEV